MKLMVSTRKGLFVLEPDGSAAGGWTVTGRHFLGEPVSATLADQSGRRLLVALRLGHFGVKLHASEDAGATWEELAPPKYPPKPENAGDDSNPWTLDQLWVMEGFSARHPERIWAGTCPGGLFRSDDAGRNWTLIESLWQMPERKQWFGGGYDVPGIHSVCVNPSDENDIVVGVSCGGAWRTTDAGQTWTAGRGMLADFMPPERRDDPVIQDPHRIVRCASTPNALWTQHHCGIWKSLDHGMHWQRIESAKPSAFGFAVVVDPGDANKAWFMPAIKDEKRIPVDGRMVASHTADGGDTFRVLADGLPQRDAYDLVYRHGMDISADGRWLAAGSTTGGLWVTQPESGRWTEINRSLPPIYAVRFFGR